MLMHLQISLDSRTRRLEVTFEVQWLLLSLWDFAALAPFKGRQLALSLPKGRGCFNAMQRSSIRVDFQLR